MAIGMTMWIVGGNWLLRHRMRSRSIFGRRWLVPSVNWLALSRRERLQLLALAIAALAVTLLGFSLRPD